MAQKNREDEMVDELFKLKNDRQQIKMKRDDDNYGFEELLYEVKQVREQEIRARIEEDEIRKVFMNLEKSKLTAMEQERKRELQKLIAEREALRIKQNEFIQDIEQMVQNIKILDQMRQKEVSKINNVIEGMQLKQKQNTKLNEDQERSDNVAQLKLKREQLEGERLRIMYNLDRFRNKDLKAGQRGGTMNLVANAKNILGDIQQMENFNPKLHDGRFAEQQQNIYQLKQQKLEFKPFDGDEAYGSRASIGQQAVDMYKYKNPQFIVENRLRKDNTLKRQQMQSYNWSEGFVVHWDYTLGLPRRSNYSQVVFGVFNEYQVICQPRLIEHKECETENYYHNRCIFGDSHQVFQVPAHPDTLMIMEVQNPFCKRVEDNVGRTETYGWTQVDLFDHNTQLKRGKFKCPVYYGPTSPEITVEEIQNLESIPNCWVYLRIGYPNDNDYGEVKTIYPEQTQHEYIVPYIHLRGLFGRRDKVKNMRGMEESYEEYEITGLPPLMQKYGARIKEPPIQDDRKQEGLRFIIYRVDNHQARSHLRVIAALFEENNIFLDAYGLPISFNTTIHNSLDLKKQIGIITRLHYTIAQAQCLI
ncbi:unnamed protein product [Paramecium sonneborni]|uniref:Uncharacterized protein n=1 Tax=Paramecium sonneborni TaxID=65129 RepID=A0A8S1R725_9CILI|nr:unnamed protein product [Paramecium sonneborni]